MSVHKHHLFNIMNAKQLWKKSGLKGEYEAYSFGVYPDELAELVLKGLKTATSSAYDLYIAENEELPKENDYSIILDSNDNALCIIKNTKVYIKRFDEIDEDYAYKEGEGDKSLNYWRKVHEEFFRNELKSINKEFDHKMKVVCEEFELIYK